jgi:hypothetical protein
MFGISCLLDWVLEIKPRREPVAGFRSLEVGSHVIPRALLPQLRSTECILVNPFWRALTPVGLTPAQFGEIPLEEMIEKGLLFVWTPKEYLVELVDLLADKKFKYVENLQVAELSSHKLAAQLHSDSRCPLNLVRQARDCDLRAEDCFFSEPSGSPFCSTKKIMLIFRKVNPKDDSLELRHQRTCDVAFEVVDCHWQMTDFLREKIYQMIETMLPKACHMLELWGESRPRPGWTHIHLTPQI